MQTLICGDTALQKLQMVVCNHAKYTMQKQKERRGVIHDTWIRKNAFSFIKTLGYEFKIPLFKFVAKKVKKCAFSC